jgi:hypothetical protein
MNPYITWFWVIAGIYLAWFFAWAEDCYELHMILRCVALVSTLIYMYAVIIPLYLLAVCFVIVPLWQYHKK